VKTSDFINAIIIPGRITLGTATTRGYFQVGSIIFSHLFEILTVAFETLS